MSNFWERLLKISKTSRLISYKRAFETVFDCKQIGYIYIKFTEWSLMGGQIVSNKISYTGTFSVGEQYFCIVCVI